MKKKDFLPLKLKDTKIRKIKCEDVFLEKPYFFQKP